MGGVKQSGVGPTRRRSSVIFEDPAPVPSRPPLPPLLLLYLIPKRIYKSGTIVICVDSINHNAVRNWEEGFLCSTPKRWYGK